MLLGKYSTSAPFLDCLVPTVTSHCWRNILLGRDLMKTQLGWVVGNGESINIWSDPWLSSTDQIRPMGPQTEATQYLKFSDLLNQQTKDSNIYLILPFHKEQILILKPSLLDSPDKLKWLNHPTGEYTTKTDYFDALNQDRQTTLMCIKGTRNHSTKSAT